MEPLHWGTFCSPKKKKSSVHRIPVHTHPGAVIAHCAAPGQTRVEVGDAVGAAHGSVLVDPAAAVDVAAARQVAVSHRQGRPEQSGRRAT